MYKAHPRSRGENDPISSVGYSRTGSSPLTRGKRSHPAGLRSRARLIPAHAGKTPTSREIASRSTAHPRSRGENWFSSASTISRSGSSPLTRGKLEGAAHARVACRLIPAHAGKTPSYLVVR